MADLTASTVIDGLMQATTQQGMATFVVDGAAINPASIGSATPSTGSFTTLSASGSVTVALGSVGSPSLVSAFGSSTGILFDAGGLGTGRVLFSISGNVVGAFDATSFGFALGAELQFANGQTRISGPAANTLALRNGTAGQTLAVYASYTDDSNYSRLTIGANGTGSNYVVFGIDEQGSGVGVLANGFSFQETLLLQNFGFTTINNQTPVGDGTYIVGLGGFTNGTIAVTNGIITAIQQAS